MPNIVVCLSCINISTRRLLNEDSSIQYTYSSNMSNKVTVKFYYTKDISNTSYTMTCIYDDNGKISDISIVKS